MSKFIGDVSAYAYAVSKGYTGTEEEFAELMASYADVGQTAVDAKDAAVAAKTAAQTAATTATTKASEATTAATTATTKAGEASTSASTATSAKDTAVSASQTATTKATEATTAAATATSAKTDAVAANTAAQSAKTAAQTAQTGAETAAASVSASAAQIQTNADDISELKEDLNEYTGISEITFTSGGYIKLSDSTADINTVVSDPSFRHAVVSCVKGDKFTVNVTGGSAPRAWGFVALNGTVLSVASASITVANLVLEAPADSAYLVINDNSNSSSFIGELITNGINRIDNAVASLDNYLTHLIEGSLVNVLHKNLVIIGSYTKNDVASNPTGGGSTSRMASGIAFDLDILNNSNFVFNSDGAYNIAFVGFNDNDVCVSTPLSWLSDGTFTKSDVLTNSRGGSYSATKFGFQFKKIDGTGGIVPFLIDKYCTVNKYLSLPTNSIKDDAVTEQKLSAEVRDKINGINKNVDVIMFMGQSNMAGRGNSAQAPALINGAGYEYRAISAPNTLSPMVEPFGATESNPQGIDEGSAKTGSMVVAFTNAYYTHNGKVPVVGISASKGGTTIADWQPDGAYLNDAISRLSSCVNYLTTNGYTIRHKFILWCQGESDGDNNITSEDYKTAFDAMLAEMISEGIEKLFLVRIGNLNSGTSTKYETIMDCQTDIAQTEPNVVMASTDFAGMRSRGMMPDQFHYTQAAYNEVGTYSGVNVAMFVVSGKEPTMYDTQDGTLYYSHKN